MRKVNQIERPSKEEFELTLLQDEVAPIEDLNRSLKRIAKVLEWFKEQEEDRVKSRSAR